MTSRSSIPPRESHHDVIVVGGGPTGSAVAAIGARHGLDVLLLEAGRHPRPHVGESLLPGIIPVLSEMGALEEVEAEGFWSKSGTTHWRWGRTPEWDLWFRDTDLYDHAWLVDRSRFDEILFRAASRAGATTKSRAAVRQLLWEDDRLRGVRWKDREAGTEHVATARLTVDASGQSALIARELGLRRVVEGLRHRAAWAHFENAGRLAPPKRNQALFVAERGHWMWLFPLTETRASVGVVQLDGENVSSDFDQIVRESELMSETLGPHAERVTPVRSERDWSYRMERVVGAGWILAGDASGFIDPVLSTGVFLGMHAGWHAARTAHDVVTNTVGEPEALAEYQTHHREMFSDLLRMVRFYYQQNLHVEDYFWESKRILLSPETDLKPQKAFLILTSGLVRNLAFDRVRNETEAYRRDRTSADGRDLAENDPGSLGFVCFRFEQETGGEPALVFVLLEPSDPTAPTLFRTRNFDVNCIAPRYGNDPISEPSLKPHLRALERRIRSLDTRAGESLASFWRRTRGDLAAAVQEMGPDLRLVRVFGE